MIDRDKEVWTCWVVQDCEERVFGVFPDEIEALRFANFHKAHYLDVRCVESGSVLGWL